MLEGWNNETVLHENRSYFYFTVALLLRQNILPVPSRRCHMNFRRDVRPRTITKELGTRQLIFIGVMTAEKFLDTRAKAVYGTWGKTVPGKLEFFSSSSSQTRLELPVVSLQGGWWSLSASKKIHAESFAGVLFCGLAIFWGFAGSNFRDLERPIFSVGN